MAVGKVHRWLQLLCREVPGKSPHAKVRPSQVHRIRAIENSHLQPFHVPRRRQQLWFSLFIRHIGHC